jgi:hypothetical protein
MPPEIFPPSARKNLTSRATPINCGETVLRVFYRIKRASSHTLPLLRRLTGLLPSLSVLSCFFIKKDGLPPITLPQPVLQESSSTPFATGPALANTYTTVLHYSPVYYVPGIRIASSLYKRYGSLCSSRLISAPPAPSPSLGACPHIRRGLCEAKPRGAAPSNTWGVAPLMPGAMTL